MTTNNAEEKLELLQLAIERRMKLVTHRIMKAEMDFRTIPPTPEIAAHHSVHAGLDYAALTALKEIIGDYHEIVNVCFKDDCETCEDIKLMEEQAKLEREQNHGHTTEGEPVVPVQDLPGYG